MPVDQGEPCMHWQQKEQDKQRQQIHAKNTLKSTVRLCEAALWPHRPWHELLLLAAAAAGAGSLATDGAAAVPPELPQSVLLPLLPPARPLVVLLPQRVSLFLADGLKVRVLSGLL